MSSKKNKKKKTKNEKENIIVENSQEKNNEKLNEEKEKIVEQKEKKQEQETKQNEEEKVVVGEEKVEDKTVEEKEEKKPTEKKEDVPKTEIIKKEKVSIKKENFNEKPEKTQKMKIIITSIALILFIVLLFSSIIFAVMNSGSQKIVDGVYVNNLNISGLTTREAKAKLDAVTEKQLARNINLTHENEILTTISPADIEFTYDYKDEIKEAYNVGRANNIFINNFEIISTFFTKKNIDIKYNYNEELLEKIIEGLDTNIPDLVVDPSYYREEDELIIVPGKDGVVVEKEQLKEQIISTIRSENESTDVNLNIPTKATEAEKIDVEKIQKEIFKEPKDAYYVEEPFELVLDEDGIDFAISIEEAKEIVAEEKEEYSIPLKITKAKVTINDIDSSAFRYQVSTFTTNYDPGYTSRVNNLKLAAGKIDGTVLRPGEEFSFNNVVGKRTIEAGYTDAKIFSNGEVIDGTGGGICQISTTLYNAALLANLEITDRRNHNYTTSYIKAGRDATVVYGAIDFKFKNTRKYPIKIEASVSGGVARFTIYGIEEENEYEIKINPVITDYISVTTQYVDDPSLSSGSEVVKQQGSSGCKVTTYKEVYLDGKFISKEVISNDVYKAMPKIIRRGTAYVSTSADTDDEEEEYVEEVTEETEVQEETPLEVPDVNGEDEE